MVCEGQFTEAHELHSPYSIWCLLGSTAAISNHQMFGAGTLPINKEKECVSGKESILKELLMSKWDTRQRLVLKEE